MFHFFFIFYLRYNIVNSRVPVFLQPIVLSLILRLSEKHYTHSHAALVSYTHV